jgi:NAD(P)-dependent dehydrogenase (short-subunit alcohol dehydrogenase family)
MKIAGSIALVTGANRGLGLNFVEALIDFGAAKVYAAARDIATLDPLVDKFAGLVAPLALDVTDQAEVEAAAAAAGDVTLLINNAGALDQHGLLEADDLSGFEWEMAVNVYGLARMCRAFAPIIEANAANAAGGAITNMLSVASLISFPPFGTYAATKAAAMSLTDCLRYELREKGVEVFGVYAGFIDTDMLDNVAADKTAPAEIARNTMRGMEAGDINIDTDERANMVRPGLRNDPEAVTALSWERAVEFRANHPAA